MLMLNVMFLASYWTTRYNSHSLVKRFSSAFLISHEQQYKHGIGGPDLEGPV